MPRDGVLISMFTFRFLKNLSPTGVIAQTQTSAIAVAEEVVSDWKESPSAPKPGSQRRLTERNINYISFDDWLFIEECERRYVLSCNCRVCRMGRMLGKPREKIVDVTEFLRTRKFRKTYR